MEKMLESVDILHTHTSNLIDNKLQLTNCSLFVDYMYQKIIKDGFKTCIEIYEF